MGLWEGLATAGIAICVIVVALILAFWRTQP
jgi:hypothetical protein